jgi:hypothetical protein
VQQDRRTQQQRPQRHQGQQHVPLEGAEQQQLRRRQQQVWLRTRPTHWQMPCLRLSQQPQPARPHAVGRLEQQHLQLQMVWLSSQKSLQRACQLQLQQTKQGQQYHGCRSASAVRLAGSSKRQLMVLRLRQLPMLRQVETQLPLLQQRLGRHHQGAPLAGSAASSASVPPLHLQATPCRMQMSSRLSRRSLKTLDPPRSAGARAGSQQVQQQLNTAQPRLDRQAIL